MEASANSQGKYHSVAHDADVGLRKGFTQLPSPRFVALHYAFIYVLKSMACPIHFEVFFFDFASKRALKKLYLAVVKN